MSRHQYLKVWYEVQSPPGHWFIHKKYKLSSKFCKTWKKAKSVAIGLKNLYPNEDIVIIKYFMKNGQRWDREYIL